MNIGNINLSENGKSVTISLRRYSIDASGYCSVSDYDESYNISELTDDKLIFENGYGDYTFTYEYNKGGIDGLKEKYLSDVNELLNLKPVDFYVNERNAPLVRTLTSVTGAKCTASVTKENYMNLDKHQKGYVPGCMHYKYDFKASGELLGKFVTNIDTCQKHFLSYIEYLDNNPYVEKLDVTVDGIKIPSGSFEMLGGFKEISYRYFVGGKIMLVSWHNFEISYENSIWITFGEL